MRYPLVDGQGNFGSVDGDPRRRHALHRGAPDRDRRRAARRHRQGHRRLRATTTTARRSSRRSCRRAARTCSSTARRASRSAWRRTSRRTTSARSSTRRRPHRQPRDHHRRPVPVRHRARTSRPAARSSASRRRRNPFTGEQETIDAIRECTPTAAAASSCAPRSRSKRSRQDRTAIIVTELPYQVNKATLIEKIAELVKDKKIDGISDLRDESDRDGMRIVIELKRDANPHKVLNHLFKHTAMQTAFSVNMLALVDGQPQTLPLKTRAPATTSTTAARSSAAGPSSTSARPGSARTSSRASRSRSTTSTRSSRPSASRPTSRRRATT